MDAFGTNRIESLRGWIWFACLWASKPNGGEMGGGASLSQNGFRGARFHLVNIGMLDTWKFLRDFTWNLGTSSTWIYSPCAFGNRGSRGALSLGRSLGDFGILCESSVTLSIRFSFGDLANLGRR